MNKKNIIATAIGCVSVSVCLSMLGSYELTKYYVNNYVSHEVATTMTEALDESFTESDEVVANNQEVPVEHEDHHNYQVTEEQLNTRAVSLTTRDGDVLEYTIPESMYNLSTEYANSLNEIYGVDSITPDNLFIAGDAMSLYSSVNSINASPMSKVEEIYKCLYGDDFDTSAVAYSTAYLYMQNGVIPEDCPDDYTINEHEAVHVKGITYRVFEVHYTSLSENEDGEAMTVSTDCLMSYSDTEDSVEIVIYTGDWDINRALELLHDLLGA